MDKENWNKLQEYLELFSELDIKLCFLYMTKTAFDKSIIDATIPVTNFLKENSLHDYTNQKQGPENTKVIESKIILDNELISFNTSLYRPITKKGDNRIWFRDLKTKLTQEQFGPDSFIGITFCENKLYIFNLNDEKVIESLIKKEFVYNILQRISNKQNSIANELLMKIKNIYDEGFIQTTVNGDTGIGMTLENKLGIEPNSSRNPDYKGIEIKSYRVGEKQKALNRSNLFSKVPDWRNSNYHSSKELLDEFGYIDNKNRIGINCTLKCNEPNSKGFYLNIDKNENKLHVLHEDENVVEWDLEVLHESLNKKHHETFWVEAESRKIEGIEYFKYQKIIHTKNPQTSLFDLLLESGVITVDFVMHIKENGSARDHGYLFKISKDNLNKLFPKIKEYNFSNL